MALPREDQEWVNYLNPILDREKSQLKLLNDEYEMQSPRAYMHPEIMREIGDRLQQVVIAWPKLVVDSVEERLDPEGFRLPDDDSADDDLWRVWQANNLDEETQLGRVDALVMKRSYIAVGTNEDDANTPLVTVESPLEVFAHIDPRTRKVRAALRRWQDTVPGMARQPEEYATLYLPDRTVYYQVAGHASGDSWKVLDTDEHGLGMVPIVPVVNRARLADRYGKSELSPILPLAQAANKLATDMMVAAEFVALPLRGIFGIGPADLQDQDGNALTALQAILGRLLTIPDDEGNSRQFEFASADLSNFHTSINQLAKLVASIAGLPPHYLGETTENPASADAIRSGEIRLIKRAERIKVPFGGSYENTGRLVKRFQEGDWDPKYRRLETIWRDSATPTVAQKADAAVKLYNLPKPIVPRRQTREDLGYTDAQIARMEVDDEKEAAMDPVGQMTKALGQNLPDDQREPRD